MSLRRAPPAGPVGPVGPVGSVGPVGPVGRAAQSAGRSLFERTLVKEAINAHVKSMTRRLKREPISQLNPFLVGRQNMILDELRKAGGGGGGGGGGGAPPPPPPPLPPPPSTPAPRVLAAEKAIQKLEERLAQLEAGGGGGATSGDADVDALEKDLEDALQTIQGLDYSQKRLQTTLENREAKIAKLESDFSLLKGAFVSKLQDELLRTEQDLERLKQKKSQVESTLESVESQTQGVEDDEKREALAEQKATLQAELSRIRAEILSKTPRLLELKGRLGEFAAEVTLEAMIQKIDGEMLQLEQDFEKAREEGSEEVDTLKTDLASKRARAEYLRRFDPNRTKSGPGRTRAPKGRTPADTAAPAFWEQVSDIAQLNPWLAEFRDRLARAQADALKDDSNLRKEIEDYQLVIQDLREKLTKSKDEGDAARMAQVEALEKALEVEKKQVQSLMQELEAKSNLASQYENQWRAVGQQLEDSQKDLKAKEDKVDELESEILRRTVEAAVARSEIQGLEEKLKEAARMDALTTAEREMLKTQVEVAVRELAGMEATLEEYKRAAESAQSQFDEELARNKMLLEELQTRRETLEKETGNLKVLLDKEAPKFDELEELLDKGVPEKRALTGQL